LEQAELKIENEPNESEGRGLDFGITSYDIRILCDNPWDGGAGYTPHEVSKMTPDQVYFRLCDKRLLKRTKGVRKAVRASAEIVSDDGIVKGRSVDGTEIKAKLRVGGKSLARRLMEAEERKNREGDSPRARRQKAREERQLAREERQRTREAKAKTEIE